MAAATKKMEQEMRARIAKELRAMRAKLVRGPPRRDDEDGSMCVIGVRLSVGFACIPCHVFV